MTCIDAHHHLWDRNLLGFDYSWQDNDTLRPICRSFLPPDLLPLLQAAGVDRTVLVQTQHHLEENRWALGLTDQSDWIAGVVGWVDLSSPDVERQLEEFASHPKFVGIRHITQDEPDDDFIVREDVLRGLRTLESRQLPFDLLFYTKHLHHADALGRLLPELPMVIDHLAKPRIKSSEIDDWKKDLAAAAKHPQIYCKLSGLVTEADWSCWCTDDLRPYVEFAIEQFSPQRCMFGSDWPVCLLAAEYGQAKNALAECLAGLSSDEQAAIWGETATQFYRLSS